MCGPDGGKNMRGGVAPGYVAVLIFCAIVVISVAAYILTPRNAQVQGENPPLQGEGSGIRHLVNSSGGGADVGLDVGRFAPDFVDAHDNAFSLTGLRGRVVVLDFMATWCGPCRLEMSHLKEVFSAYGRDQVVVISIDVDPTEGDEAIGSFRDSYGDNWIFASGPEVGSVYGVLSIPTIYVIDRNGVIAYRSVGVTPFSVLSEEINRLL